MEDTIGIFSPNFYNMYTDRGNMLVANLVDRARTKNMTWPEVRRELAALEQVPGAEEATDTDVRESVFYKMGFHEQNVSFY